MPAERTREVPLMVDRLVEAKVEITTQRPEVREKIIEVPKIIE